MLNLNFLNCIDLPCTRNESIVGELTRNILVVFPFNCNI